MKQSIVIQIKKSASEELLMELSDLIKEHNLKVVIVEDEAFDQQISEHLDLQ